MKAFLIAIIIAYFTIDLVPCQNLTINLTTTNTTIININLHLNDTLLEKYINGSYLKSAPSFIPELNQNNSQCFMQLRNVIGYFSDFEQAILLMAAKVNNESNRCFDCNVYLEYLPHAYENQLEQLAQLVGQDKSKRRDTLTCLLDFGMKESSLNNSINEMVTSYLYTQGESNQCFAQFISEIGRLTFLRRRFLCAKLDDMKSMAINDNFGNIVGFKWTDEEAKEMANSFIKVTQCVNKERYTFPQTYINSVSTIALSDTCKAPNLGTNSTKFLIPGGVPIITFSNNTNTSLIVNGNPVPTGRRLNELRFLQADAINATAPITSNVTTTSTNANVTTISNITTTNNATNTPTPASNTNATTPSIVNATGPDVSAASPLSNATNANHTTHSNNTSISTTDNGNGNHANTSITTNITDTNTTIIPTHNIPAGDANTTTNIIIATPLGANLTATNTTNPLANIRVDPELIQPRSNASLSIPVITFIPATNFTFNTSLSNQPSTAHVNETHLLNTIASTTTGTAATSNVTGNATSFPVLIPVALGPALSAPLTNTPSALIQQNHTNINLNITIMNGTTFPAMENTILETYNATSLKRTLKLGNTSIPVLISNLLDYTKFDSDLYSSINQIIISAMAMKVDEFTILANHMNEKLLLNYEFNCMPSGIIKFLSNVNNSQLMMNEFSNDKCQNNTKNYTITITNGVSKCYNCSKDILLKNLTFIDKSQELSDYFFSSNCVNGKRMQFSHWVDLSGIPYTFYQEGVNNLNSRCISKAFVCSSEIAMENYCPTNYLNPICRRELAVKCKISGLYSLNDKLKYFSQNEFVLPPQCSFGNIENGNMTDFYNKCLTWVQNTFITSSLSLNHVKLNDFENMLYSTVAPRTRFLQTTNNSANSANSANNVVIIPASEDPTRNDAKVTIVKNTAFNNSVIVVDGARPGIFSNNTNNNRLVAQYFKNLGTSNTTVMSVVNGTVIIAKSGTPPLEPGSRPVKANLNNNSNFVNLSINLVIMCAFVLFLN